MTIPSVGILSMEYSGVAGIANNPETTVDDLVDLLARIHNNDARKADQYIAEDRGEWRPVVDKCKNIAQRNINNLNQNIDQGHYETNVNGEFRARNNISINQKIVEAVDEFRSEHPAYVPEVS